MNSASGNAGESWIAGLDEVGRGCLAGPVYAAAVVLGPRHGIRGLRDSKKLTAAQREALVPKIEARAIAWGLGSASVEEIDAINILQATFLAMRRALDALPRWPQLCRIDGNQRPRGWPCAVETLVGGDDREASIMAASILAKVARDAELRRLDALHAGYGFAEHKGYGTPQHLQALLRLGPSVIHRRSFAPCRVAQLPLLDAGIGPVEPLAEPFTETALPFVDPSMD